MFGWTAKYKMPPQRMCEASGARDGAFSEHNAASHGLFASTRVATSMGWRCVEAILPGDLVLTFDNGLQAVREIRRSVLRPVAPNAPAHLRPLFVPSGAMGNRADIFLPASQGLLIESDAAMDKHGDPFAVIQAQSLDGCRGMSTQVPCTEIEVFTLYFESDQVIYVEGTLMAYCPAAHMDLSQALNTSERDYDVLSAKDSAFLAGCLSEHVTAAL